jgi:hypothetical protein
VIASTLSRASARSAFSVEAVARYRDVWSPDDVWPPDDVVDGGGDFGGPLRSSFSGFRGTKKPIIMATTNAIAIQSMSIRASESAAVARRNGKTSAASHLP